MNHFEGPGADDLKRMMKHFPVAPGHEDMLRILGIKRKAPDTIKPDPKDKKAKEALGKGGGGLSANAKKILADRKQSEPPNEPPLEIFEYPTLEQAKPEEEVEEEPAVLADAAWHEPDTLFHQEAEVSVKLALPQGKEHITRIQVELLANTPSGPESISKGEGWAQADGTAVAKVPVYKPKGHDDGPVEYFFRVMHSLAKMVSTEMQPRTVSEMALKSADHILISGVTFEKDSSFIGTKGTQALKPLEAKFNEWEKKYPKKAQIAVFGHTDKGEKDAKGLSERRAQSAFAFITNDAATWDNLYRAEAWGLKALQTLLKDLGHYHGGLDGGDGPKTQAAFKAFQKGAGLPETGSEDSATRKALFAAYMKGKHDIKIEASRFLKVAGHAWMGCAAHNQVKESEGVAPENRRVAFVLINPSKHFPVNFPCKDGSEEACQGQCKKEGKRSGAGIKCLFYDQMVREEKQAADIKVEPSSIDEPDWMKFAKKELDDHVTEIKGANHNPRILEYHQTTKQKMDNDDNTGAWCASFVNWCFFKSGHSRMNSALAADWKSFGRKVEEPVIGSVAVVHFTEGGYHVGFVVGQKGNRILVLGGNQDGGTKVSISGIPKSWIQCYRMPEEYSGPNKIAVEKEGDYGQDSYTGTR